LSQLIQAALPSGSKPAPFPKLSWPDFVQLVLVLTIDAYRAMYQDRVAQLNWEENTFTSRLKDYLQWIAFDFNVRVNFRHKIHTPEMDKGEQPTKQAKEIDLSLYGTWEIDYHRKHFVWEAKRVGDKRINREYGNLNSEYVHEAIYRFIKRHYAEGLNDAGILGYVLAGDIANIVSDINTSMGNIEKNPPLPDSNHLCLVEPINNFEHIYQSRHTRTDNTNINLYHLFLAFEFA
jgi:hypothetical protein